MSRYKKALFVFSAVITSVVLCLFLNFESRANGGIFLQGDKNSDTRIEMLEDMTLILTTKDTIATTEFRYKTIGFTITRQNMYLTNSPLKDSMTIETGTYAAFRDFRADGNYVQGNVEIMYENYVPGGEGKQWIEFSLDSANVQVKTTEKGTIQENVWTIPGEKVREIIGGMYPDWVDALDALLLAKKNNEKIFVDGMEAMRVDSIMTVVHRVSGENKVKGVIDDPGNGRVVTSGLTYWNGQEKGMRCGHCNDNALFETCLYEGYPVYDVLNISQNIKQNERICWKCPYMF